MGRAGSLNLFVPSRTSSRQLAARHIVFAPEACLSCWQHGVAVLDEPFTGTANLPAGGVFSVGAVGSQRLLVFGQGTGLCLVTQGEGRGEFGWR